MGVKSRRAVLSRVIFVGFWPVSRKDTLKTPDGSSTKQARQCRPWNAIASCKGERRAMSAKESRKVQQHVADVLMGPADFGSPSLGTSILLGSK